MATDSQKKDVHETASESIPCIQIDDDDDDDNAVDQQDNGLGFSKVPEEDKEEVVEVQGLNEITVSSEGSEPTTVVVRDVSSSICESDHCNGTEVGRMDGKNLSGQSANCQNSTLHGKEMAAMESRKMLEEPPYPISVLIAMALTSVPNRRLTARGIFQFIRDRFPYYGNSDKKWMNTVRRSLRSSFSQEPQGYWTVDPILAARFLEYSKRSEGSRVGSGSRFRRARQNYDVQETASESIPCIQIDDDSGQQDNGLGFSKVTVEEEVEVQGLKEIAVSSEESEPTTVVVRDVSSSICESDHYNGTEMAAIKSRQMPEKPPYTISVLIAMALTSAPNQRLTISGIYQFIRDRFPYYRCINDKKWMQSVRSCLSIYFSREGSEKSGSPGYWTVDPIVAARFLEYSKVLNRIHAKRRKKATDSQKNDVQETASVSIPCIQIDDDDDDDDDDNAAEQQDNGLSFSKVPEEEKEEEEVEVQGLQELEVCSEESEVIPVMVRDMLYPISESGHCTGSDIVGMNEENVNFILSGQCAKSTNNGKQMSAIKSRKTLEKPPYPASVLIGMALTSAPNQRLTTSGVYQFLRDRFPYYRCTNNKKWMQTVRTTLNSHFSLEASGYWTVDPLAAAKLLEYAKILKLRLIKRRPRLACLKSGTALLDSGGKRFCNIEYETFGKVAQVLVTRLEDLVMNINSLESHHDKLQMALT